jgi:hypothetical protein
LEELSNVTHNARICRKTHNYTSGVNGSDLGTGTAGFIGTKKPGWDFVSVLGHGVSEFHEYSVLIT